MPVKFGKVSKRWVSKENRKKIGRPRKDGIEMAEVGKNGAKLRMTKSAEFALNQKLKEQDSMFR